MALVARPVHNSLVEVREALNQQAIENGLEAFGSLHHAINAATGNLPTRTVDLHIRLARGYSTINSEVRKGLANANGQLSKFVVKGAAVIRHGEMTAADIAALQGYIAPLNAQYITDLENWVSESKDTLIGFHTSLLLQHRDYSEMNQLLDQKEVLENQLLAKENELMNQQMELAKKQGELGEAQFRADLAVRIRDNQETASAQYDQRIAQLVAQIPAYEQQVANHRDHHYEERGSFMFFTWKVRDVHVDNGEKVHRENLNNLNHRIAQLRAEKTQSQQQDWQSMAQQAARAIPELQTLIPQLATKCQQLEAERQQLKTEFEAHCRRIIERFNEVASKESKESLEHVTRLAKAVYDGAESLNRGYSTFLTYVRMLDVDPDLLIQSMQAAISIITAADAYNGTQSIKFLRNNPTLALTN